MVLEPARYEDRPQGDRERERRGEEVEHQASDERPAESPREPEDRCDGDHGDEDEIGLETVDADIRRDAELQEGQDYGSAGGEGQAHPDPSLRTPPGSIIRAPRGTTAAESRAARGSPRV